MTRKLNQHPVIDLKTVGDCSSDSDIIFSQLTDSGCTPGTSFTLIVVVVAAAVFAVAAAVVAAAAHIIQTNSG